MSVDFEAIAEELQNMNSGFGVAVTANYAGIPHYEGGVSVYGQQADGALIRFDVTRDPANEAGVSIQMVKQGEGAKGGVLLSESSDPLAVADAVQGLLRTQGIEDLVLSDDIAMSDDAEIYADEIDAWLQRAEGLMTSAERGPDVADSDTPSIS